MDRLQPGDAITVTGLSRQTQPPQPPRRAARERIRIALREHNVMAFRRQRQAEGQETEERGNRPLFKRRKFCRFTAEKIKEIDYKDVELLKDFINENGKIIPARITGTKAHYQRQLSVAVKRARYPGAAAVHRRALRSAAMQDHPPGKGRQPRVSSATSSRYGRLRPQLPDPPGQGQARHTRPTWPSSRSAAPSWRRRRTKRADRRAGARRQARGPDWSRSRRKPVWTGACSAR